MKRTSRYTFILFILSLGLYFLDRNFFISRVLPNEFRDSLCDLVRSKPASPVDLSKLTSFNWEKVFIFGPYATEDYINSTLGFDWSGASSTGISYSEGINLLVFVSEGNNVQWFRIPRTCGDFELPAELNGFDNENSKFLVSVKDHGEPWLVLTPLGK